MGLTPRDLLFGDLPADAWPSGEKAQGEPWAAFIRARERARSGDLPGSVETLRAVLVQPGLESRHHAQAWHLLRVKGEAPSAAEAKRVLGVVVEVGMDQGQDMVAAYADRTARYFNVKGCSVVWDRPDPSLDGPVTALVEAGQVLAPKIGPWDGERPPPVKTGQVRVNLITPSGLHFGQGPFEALARDQLGGPTLHAANILMQALIAKSEEGRGRQEAGATQR